ncbi:hypothetical protein SEVIR_1G305575v4 [Setaria viridis]
MTLGILHYEDWSPATTIHGIPHLHRLRALPPHARRPPDQRRGQRRVRERHRAVRAAGHCVDLEVLGADRLPLPDRRIRRAVAGPLRRRRLPSVLPTRRKRGCAATRKRGGATKRRKRHWSTAPPRRLGLPVQGGSRCCPV